MATVETRETVTRETAGVTLTEAAASKVRELIAQEPAGEADVLRIAIQGGGCGGFEYQLGFDRGPTADDSEVEFYGVRVVVDPASAQYLKGATIDFVNSLQESGFKVDNPNASGSCGCGHSFHVAEEGDEHVQGAAEHPAGCSH